MTCTLIMSLSTGIKNINTRAHDEFNNIYFSAVIIHLKHDYDIWEIHLLAFKHIVCIKLGYEKVFYHQKCTLAFIKIKENKKKMFI